VTPVRTRIEVAALQALLTVLGLLMMLASRRVDDSGVRSPATCFSRSAARPAEACDCFAIDSDQPDHACRP
jgi:hypothetical protein